MCDDLKSSTDARGAENCETLLDVQSACRTSVEILNDLLCFDKLESGILELHKHDVMVMPFIEDCVNMFASQAREAGVTVTNSTVTSSPQGSALFDGGFASFSGLLYDDTVHMDKFKMDQVLRNLISNALKFTPRGGSVSVYATFVPAGGGCIESVSGPPPPPAVTKMSIWPWSYRSFLSRWVLFHRHRGRDNRVHVAAEEDSVCALESGPCTPRQPPSALLLETVSPRNERESPHASNNEGPTSADHRHPLRAPPCLNEECRPTCGTLRIVVKDSGCGISDVNQLKLFTEIVQFDPEVLQAGGGSGLGLWITSNIVKMHGGSISVYSAGLDRGSKFTVEIDMQRVTATGSSSMGSRSGSAFSYFSDAAAREPSPAQSSHHSLGSHTHRQMLRKSTCRSARVSDVPGPDPSPPPVQEHEEALATYRDPVSYDVLVVDDSGLNRKLLCKLFRAAGHSCEEACDGLVAIEKVEKKMVLGPELNPTYDAILMDYVMPNMDGPSATQIIRDLGYRGPIFGVTGNALDSDVNHFRRCGADAVLAKPFDFIRFQQLMEAMHLP